jgi:hypothetical protein
MILRQLCKEQRSDTMAGPITQRSVFESPLYAFENSNTALSHQYGHSPC